MNTTKNADPLEPGEDRTSTKSVEEEFPNTTKVTYTPKIFSIENNGGTLNYGY